METVEMDCALTVAIHSTFHDLLDKVNVLTKFGSDTVVGVEITKAAMVCVRPRHDVFTRGGGGSRQRVHFDSAHAVTPRLCN